MANSSAGKLGLAGFFGFETLRTALRAQRKRHTYKEVSRRRGGSSRLTTRLIGFLTRALYQTYLRRTGGILRPRVRSGSFCHILSVHRWEFGPHAVP